MESKRYELKYCEGCGTLRLRPVASPESYCRRCEERLSRFVFRGKGGKRSIGLPAYALPLRSRDELLHAAMASAPVGGTQ